MTCWFCKRPIILPSIVKNVITDTRLIGENVRMTEQSVKCSSCGSTYTVEVYLDSRPTVSNEMLAKLSNISHP